MINNKTEQKRSNVNKLTFWLINFVNLFCMLLIICTAWVNFVEYNESVVFDIAVYAICQAYIIALLNNIFYKAAKDKEVFLDE